MDEGEVDAEVSDEVLAWRGEAAFMAAISTELEGVVLVMSP